MDKIDSRNRALDSDYFEIRFLQLGECLSRLEVFDSRMRRIEDEARPIESVLRPQISAAEDQALASSTTPEIQPVTYRDLVGNSDPDLESTEIGLRLFEWLFTPKIRAFFERDVGRVEQKGRRLCLVLSFDLKKSQHRRLFSLPWERLRNGDEPWVLNAHPIVRRLLVEHSEPDPAAGRRLRILAIPAAEEGLDLERERRSLRRIQREGGPFDLKIVDQSPSINELRNLLEEGSFHVLHVMGHGRRHEGKEGGWVLELGKETVSAGRLGLLLAEGALNLRLVVLNTCHSARVDDSPSSVGDNPSLGLAGELVRRGVIAVLGNRTAVGDTAAFVLTQGLYRRLARRVPLDQALSRARLDLRGTATGEVAAEEWATPILLLRAPPRQTRGHVLELPEPAESLWTPGGLALGLLLLIFLGYGATAATIIAHTPELLAGAISLVALLGRVAWGWLDRSDPYRHPLNILASYLEQQVENHRPLSSWVVSVGLATALTFWLGWGLPNFQDIPCRREAIGDFDPTHGVVALDFRAQDSTVEWPEVWKEDLLETLRRSGLTPVTDNRLQEETSPTCFAWRIKAESSLDEDGRPSSYIKVFRRSELRDAWYEPLAPGEIDGQATAWLISALGLGSYHESLSRPTREANSRAMHLYGSGDLRAAADLLQESVQRDRDAPAARNNLAQVLLDLAREKRRDTVSAYTDQSLSNEEKALELTLRASQHLDQALYLDPRNATYHYNQGRVLADLGRLVEAEKAFRTALWLAPELAHAANDLAVLLMEDGRPAQLEEAIGLLERAEIWVPIEDIDTRVAILSHLGEAYRLSSRLSRAWQFLDAAECLAPIESFQRRAEILFRAAQVHEALMGPATAAVTWRRYGAVLGHDADPANRREFFAWMSRYSDQIETGELHQGPWVDRCRKSNDI